MLCLCLLLLAVCGSAVKCGGYTTGADMAKNHDMSGKILLITGGDSGIGFETALATARSGGQIVIASLDPESTGAAAKQKITQNVTSAKVEVLKLDLSDFSSVRACAAAFLVQHKTLDVLMNDAGIDHNPPSLPPMTVDGYERVFQVNYLGHFLLTQLLLPALRASASSPRIINVASGAHEDACNWASAKSNCLDIDQLPPPVRALGNNTEGAPISNYGITKFLQIYHAKELALRESQAKSSVQAFSLEPGFVDTPMTRNLSPATHHKWCMFSKPCPLSEQEGSSTPTFVAVKAISDISSDNGDYFSKCEVATPKSWDVKSQHELFDLSLKWTNLTHTHTHTKSP